MTVVNSSNYVKTAAVALPIFRIQITNWGNRQTGADANSIIYGALTSPQEAIGGVYAVVVGPDSTADRVNVQYNPILDVQAPTGASKVTGQRRAAQIVSVARPAFNQLGGPLTINADRDVGYWGDTYLKDGTVAPQAFGGAEPLFEAPVLQLDLYLRPTLGGLPTQRTPISRAFSVVAVADANEHLIAIYPVTGRQRMSVMAVASGTLVASVRVGLITYSGTGSFTVNANEATAGSIVVNGNTGVQGAVSASLPVQFLAVYYTRSAGAGSVSGHMLAEDTGGVGTNSIT